MCHTNMNNTLIQPMFKNLYLGQTKVDLGYPKPI